MVSSSHRPLNVLLPYSTLDDGICRSLSSDQYRLLSDGARNWQAGCTQLLGLHQWQLAGSWYFSSSFSPSHWSSIQVTFAPRAALLNWKWSRTGGPRSTEERAMLCILVVSGWIASFRYVQVGSYPPLGCLGVAPLCSLLGWYFTK